MASYILGNAVSDENNRAFNGKPGDQKQSGSGDDYKGEVKLQPMYDNKKGWYVLRPKDPNHAVKMAERMRTACNNKCFGYSQNDRLGIIKYGINTTTNTNCDCSSLVRACIKEATGKDPGDFYTGNEVEILKKSGLFEDKVAYKSGMSLCVGDVLVTQTKGHTAMVVVGDSRTPNAPSKTEKPGGKSLEQLVQDILNGKYGNGADRKNKVIAEGWDYPSVQNAVNAALKRTTNASLKGNYRVIPKGLNLRKGPGTDYAVIDVMPQNAVCQFSGNIATNTGTNWYYVTYNGKLGYASEKFLKKI